MKNTMLYAVLLLLCASTVFGANTVSITVTKKTGDKYKGSEQERPMGTVQFSEKTIYYRFDFRSVSGTVTGMAEAEWVVLIETAEGRILSADKGRETVYLEFGKTVSVETEPFPLKKRSWSRPHRSGSAEDKVVGYGVRLTDMDGKLLAERYSPSSIESKIEWVEKKEEQRDERLKKLKKKLQRERLRP